MLEKTRSNAGILKERIHWKRMDAQHLTFEDQSFDAIVTRNLTRGLELPELTYRELFRVLKKGGILLNFDANWYHYLYDEDQKHAYEKTVRM